MLPHRTGYLEVPRKVWLNAEDTVFDETEALTLLMSTRANLQAKRTREYNIADKSEAAVIARQIRLRNIEA